jgi:hypothetical protein
MKLQGTRTSVIKGVSRSVSTMWTWAPTRKPRRRRGLVYWNAARSHSEPTTVFDDTLVFSGMTRFEKRRDKKHGRRQCHTIDIPDHRCWMQFRSALCNTHSLHRANLVSIHLRSTASWQPPPERHVGRWMLPRDLAVHINVNASAGKCGIGGHSWHTTTCQYATRRRNRAKLHAVLAC